MENVHIVSEYSAHPSTKVYRLNFFLVAIVAIVANAVQFMILPAQFFFDSYGILRLMGTNPQFVFQESFQITAYLSNMINIFQLDSLLQWSIKFSIIFNPIIYFVLRKVRIPSFLLLVWAYAAVGMLNIFVLNLSKDVFQLIMFLIIYLFLQSKLKVNTKVICCVLLLLAWGFIFRIYFGLIAGYSLMVYILFTMYTRMKLKRAFFFVAITLMGVALSLLILRIFAPQEYSVIFEVRRQVNMHRMVGDYAYARTMIVSIFPYGESLFLFMINYVINTFRLMFPIELLLHFSPRLWLFFAFQISLAYIVVKNIKSVLKRNASPERIIALSVYIGFLLGSALFQPDFGSWVRHSTTLFPIFMILVAAKKPEHKEKEAVNTSAARENNERLS